MAWANQLEEEMFALRGSAWRLACWIVGDVELAEDAVQEAFLNAWRARRGLRDLGSVRSWLLRIVANTARNTVRGEERLKAREYSMARFEEGSGDPAEMAAREEAAAAVRKALAGLDESLRLPLLLHYVEGLPHHEIASVLDMPEGTCRKYVSRGIERLREALSEAGFGATVPMLPDMIGSGAAPPLPPSLEAAVRKLLAEQATGASSASPVGESTDGGPAGGADTVGTIGGTDATGAPDAAGSAGAKGGGLPLAEAKGGTAMKIMIGAAAAILTAVAGISVPEFLGGEKNSGPSGASGAAAVAPKDRRGRGSPPSAEAPGSMPWQEQRYVVEEFTMAMGGGPKWGPVEGVGVSVSSMAQDKDGNRYIAVGNGTSVDGEQYIDLVTPDGIRCRLAGTGRFGYRDGPADHAEFRMGVGSYYGFSNIGVDDRGNVFVPDNGNDCVRRIFKNAEGKWTVETYAGRGTKELKPGESCAPREAKIRGNLHVAVATDGTLTIGAATLCYRVSADGKKLTCLGGWPLGIGHYGGKPAQPGDFPIMRHCGGGADRNGNAYFGARSNDVVCQVDAAGKITHIAGVLAPSREAGGKLPDGPPLEAFFDTIASAFVEFSGECVYVCGGDNDQIRRVPTDLKTTTATLLNNGMWYVKRVPNNGDRVHANPKQPFDPAGTGKPKSEGGNLGDLMCSPLVGIDRDGTLYGRMQIWDGLTHWVKGPDGPRLLPTRVFKIRRVK